MSSLVELSLKVCLDYWRHSFINPQAMCQMKWPDAMTISDVIERLKGKLLIRDIKGMCISMMEADPNFSFHDWLKLLYRIQSEYEQESEYYLLLNEVCSKMSMDSKWTLTHWTQFLSNEYISLSIDWVYALHKHINIGEDLNLYFEEKLESKIIDPILIDLICFFNLETLAPKLQIQLQNEAESMLQEDRHFQENYIETNFSKWLQAVTHFECIADMVLNLSTVPRLQATLCQIQHTWSQKYQDFLIKHPDIVYYATIQGITPKIYTDYIFMEKIFKYMMSNDVITPKMIQMALQMFPEKVLNHLYNPKEISTICKFQHDSDNNTFTLSGVIIPFELFSLNDIQSIINKYRSEIKQILFPNARNGFSKTFGGERRFSEDPMEFVSKHVNDLLNNIESLENFRFDHMIKKIYQAYEEVQSIRLSKIWKPFIEFMEQCSTVTVEQLQYSGIPTSRSKLIISNINVDIFSQIYPKVCIQKFNQVFSYTPSVQKVEEGSTINDKLLWICEKNSFIEYYTNISYGMFEVLSEYQAILNKFGVYLEDLAIRKATEKFQSMEKILNRQSSRKGNDYDRESKWNELLSEQQNYQGKDRYRLTVRVSSVDIFEQLTNIQIDKQQYHLREITYIYAGLDFHWELLDKFTYVAEYQILNPNKEKQLIEMMSKSGFQMTIVEQIVVETYKRKVWQIIGMYNGYNYLPINDYEMQTFVDDEPTIPLDKNYTKILIGEILNHITDKKLINTIRSQINLAFMRARTTRKDGKLNESKVEEIKLLVKGFKNMKQLQEFRKEIREILPEYTNLETN